MTTSRYAEALFTPQQSKWRIIAGNIIYNMLLSWRYSTTEGSTHWGWSPARSVDYINRVYLDYLRYAGLSRQDIAGKRVLEIGPGDNLGVALCFLADGAEQVIGLDRFFAKQDAAQQLEIYRALRQQLNSSQKKRYDAAILLDGGIHINENRLRCLYGPGVERVDRIFEPNAFDLIVSRAVLFRIYRPERSFQSLSRVLRPGGRMMHKVALIDWVFTQNGYHPLEFLTVPEPLYRMMAGNSGICNRKTIEDYRRMLNLPGQESILHITNVVESGSAPGADFPPNTTSLQEGVHYQQSTLDLISSIRPRLARKFRKLPDEVLMAEGIFLVTTKARGE